MWRHHGHGKSVIPFEFMCESQYIPTQGLKKFSWTTKSDAFLSANHQVLKTITIIVAADWAFIIYVNNKRSFQRLSVCCTQSMPQRPLIAGDAD